MNNQANQNFLESNTLSFYRQIRKEFMVASVKTGKNLLNHLRDTDPELAGKIDKAFRNEGSAAFYLMTNVNTEYSEPPFMQLAKGERDEVMKRLDCRAHMRPNQFKP